LRTVQGQGQRLLADITLAIGLQGAQHRVAQADAAGLEVDHAPLGAVQTPLQLEPLEVVFFLRQLLALQGQVALRCVQRAADVQAPFNPPLQPRP